MTDDKDNSSGLPRVGATVLDTTRNRVGRVMGTEGPYLQLRPLCGGREWDVAPADLHPLTGAELLSALVAEANARSRRVLGHGPPAET
ncbi:hypothetical protein ACWGQ4_04285 [Streptomyces sp. NPDC055721]|uniref:hypothetical protein n=1 Tax=Streptomyces sp. NPDC127132 TaxID=3345374 RepID=UPI00362D6C29